MRRQPGGWLDGEVRERNKRTWLARLEATFNASWYLGAGVALVTASLILVAFSYLRPAPAPEWLFLIVGLGFVGYGYVVGKKELRRTANDDRRTDQIAKGRDAEMRIGQVIEYAVAAPGCAVAHNVMEIAKVGDIDHLVLTPARLWIVETKSGPVPPSKFPEVLSRISTNVSAAREWAREWAPPGFEVQGCLALNSGGDALVKRRYHTEEEEILVEYPESLLKKLRSDAGTQQAADRELAKRVWTFGKVEE